MTQRPFIRRIWIPLALLLTVLTVGTLGFRNFSDLSWIDALYMTIITVTTVGFGEIGPVTPASKLFTIGIIVVSVFVFAYAIKVITEYILTTQNLDQIKKKMVKNQISALENHAIICGYGRTGREAAKKLLKTDHNIVVIEAQSTVLNNGNSEPKGIWGIEADATEENSLAQAGIHKAACLLAVLPSDADNLYIVLTARQMNPNLTIISRATHERSVSKLKWAGANHVVMPDKIGGDHMASLYVLPDVIQFVDLLAESQAGKAHLKELELKKLPKNMINQSIRDLSIREKTGCTIVGIRQANGQYTINPDPTQKLSLNDALIVMGQPHQIESFQKTFLVNT